jgi:phosphate starvation-inducible PhoH-like protein
MARVFKPKSDNQSDFIRLMVENDLVFCVGPSGSGKTACTVGLAMQYFLEEKCDRIIIIRPSLTADEEFTGGLGFLPGDLKAKTDPHFRPIYDELLTYLDKSELDKYIRDDLIEIATLDYMRGRTFHNAFVLLDEAQNCSYKLIKMITTRLGKSSKMVISGDTDQYDRRGESGLDVWFNNISMGLNGVGRMKLEKCDIVRHPLVSAILTATEEYERSLK